MKKKNLILLIAGITLVLVSVFIILFENGIFSNARNSGPASDIFSIKDTSAVTKIFLADMHQNTVLLKRTPGGWTVNDTLPALQAKIEGLLSVLMNLTVREPVPQSARSNINTVLATGAIKVEIYQIAPKFKLFGISFGTKERNTKTYYMGPSTQDNMANFALLEGMSEPYIVYVPGFRGFVTPQFSSFEYEWLSHTVFNTKITRIETVEFKDIFQPEESFTVKKAGPRSFDLFNYKNEQIMRYDTTKLIDMLSEFRNRNFESIENTLSPAEKDSIINDDLFKIIMLTDIEGKTTTLMMYKMKDQNEYEEMEGFDPEDYLWDLDRFYGTVNGKTDPLYKFQYFHMDRQVQPLSYFLK